MDRRQSLQRLSLEDLQTKYHILEEYQILKSGVKLDIGFLEHLLASGSKNILLGLDTNPFSLKMQQDMKKSILPFNGRIKILTGDISFLFRDDPLHIYFPFFYLEQRGHPNLQSNFKKFRFSFLSNQSRFHRLYLFQMMRHSITKDDCMAIHLTNFTDQESFVCRDMLKYLGKEMDIRDGLPFITDNAKDQSEEGFIDPSLKIDWSNGHNAYSSMINITGESSIEDDIIVFTEKTWKPIRSGCLFMTLGSMGMANALTKLGFSLGDGIDVDMPFMQKISWITDRMTDWDFDICRDIYEKHKKHTNHNLEYFYSDELMNIFRTHLHQRLL